MFERKIKKNYNFKHIYIFAEQLRNQAKCEFYFFSIIYRFLAYFTQRRLFAYFLVVQKVRKNLLFLYTQSKRQTRLR